MDYQYNQFDPNTKGSMMLSSIQSVQVDPTPESIKPINYITVSSPTYIISDPLPTGEVKTTTKPRLLTQKNILIATGFIFLFIIATARK